MEIFLHWKVIPFDSNGGVPIFDADFQPTSKEKIYKELRRSIITGRCHPGEKLNVNELAATYGSSITPVRDALQMLGQEGLVTIKPYSGYFVAAVTLKELRDMLELRSILELAAVERAVVRITAEQITELEHVHAGYCGDDDESYDRYTDENRRFHCQISEASGNQELAKALGHLHDRLARFMVLRRAGDTQEGTHLRLIKALRSRDSNSARQAMLEELTESHEAIVERVVQEDGALWQISS